MELGSRSSGWRAEYDFTAEDHWFVNMAEILGKESVGTLWPTSKGNPHLAIYSTCDHMDKVRAAFKHFGGEIRLIQSPESIVPRGFMAFVEVKEKQDGLIAALARIRGRITLCADPKEFPAARLIVESPLAFCSSRQMLESLGERIDTLHHITVFSKPKIAKVMLSTDEFVDVGDSGAVDVVDEKDVRIAMELFKSGYYDPAVKGKETLDAIAKKARTTKPTLIKRKKRLESLGIATMLSPRMPEATLKKASVTLKRFVKTRQN